MKTSTQYNIAYFYLTAKGWCWGIYYTQIPCRNIRW